MAKHPPQAGSDFTDGVSVANIVDGAMTTGHVGGEPALLIRRAGELFAIGARCTHYGGPLADGLRVGDEESLGAEVALEQESPA